MNKRLDYFLSIFAWAISVGGFASLAYIRERHYFITIATCIAAWVILVIITLQPRKVLGYSTILVPLSILPWLTFLGLTYMVSGMRFLQ